MKKAFYFLIYISLKFALSLRYKIRVKGLEELPAQGKTLILANHPAEIDPCILLVLLWYKFRPHPVAVDYLFHTPGIRFFLDLVGALAVPNFDLSSNSYKRREIEKTYEKLFSFLEQGENLLIYPAGGLKLGPEEVIGGASGVHTILERMPDVNIVLVRSTGLWGSSFSRALTGKTPDVGGAFLAGVKIIFKNLIFFTPKRLIEIECVAAPKDFPRKSTRLQINNYLERWYNQDGPESLKLVSYTFWKQTLPKVHILPKEEEIKAENIPPEIQQRVKEEIAALANRPPEEIAFGQHLAFDLGLDSLDQAQLSLLLKDSYGVTRLQLSELSTVGSVMAFAARLKKSEEGEEESFPKRRMEIEKNRPHPQPPVGKTIIEVFLHTSKRMDGFVGCEDILSGEVTYKRLRLTVILLARLIAKMEGERIGIMLPASIAVNAVILATMLAGKVPVMINWTLGVRNLKAVVDKSKIKRTISSWQFLNKLENVELNGIDDQIVLLEDMRREMGLKDKLSALRLSRKSPEAILRTFGVHRKIKDDNAVILFTSGTESLPKGVPLTHHNILSNLKAAYDFISIKDEDVLLGVLPSFHSFGFSITGLFPLLAGLRVAYLPNPTDGRRMAKGIEQWKITLLCIAPTFLKNLFRVAGNGQLKSLRLVVSGSEKTPQELFQKMKELGPEGQLVEGYGITECAPILTLNPPGQAQKGVGRPLSNIKLMIVHPETLQPISKEKEGLILASGPNVFSGYLDPAIKSPFVEIEGKRWYKTGDLGYLDSDGYLILSGRLKRFIKIGGEMISLASLEEILTQAAPSLGWKLDPEVPSLAVSAVEKEGKKSEIVLFTAFPVSLSEVNEKLKEEGLSNLIRVSMVKELPFIPLLGTGKVDYQTLATKL